MSLCFRRGLRAALPLAVILAFALPPAASACECDSPHVRHHGVVIKVSPTQRDDTANLRCALRVASREPGHTIELAAGQFWTRQLWAANFVGTLKGQGADRTFLSNRGPLPVSPGDDVLMSPPSHSNLWPAFLTFVDGDFTVSDLAIRMKGPQISTGYSFFGFPIENNILAEILIVGTRANASLERILVEGATIEKGYNAPWGDILASFFQPLLGNYAKPMTGRFDVVGSTFRNTAMGFNAAGVEHAQMTWHANTVEGCAAGFEIWDAAHTLLVASANRVRATGVMPGYPLPYAAVTVGGTSWMGIGLQQTSVFIIDNDLGGSEQRAIEVVPFATDTGRTVILDNKISGTTGILLGPESKGVIVKPGVAAVTDQGTGNFILP